MESIFKQVPAGNLVGFFVWTPMLGSDSEMAAVSQAEHAVDGRIQKIWDEKRELGALVSQQMHLSRNPAWDIYLVYPGGVRWKGEAPPLPAFWMHQLQGLDSTRCLNERGFMERIQKLLRKSA